MIYTDKCSKENIAIIKKDLGIDVLLQINTSSWNFNEAISILTLPAIELAVINTINEINIIECSILSFMCKPILITTPSINNYKIFREKIINYINFSCQLTTKNSFVEWYRNWKK